MSKQRNPSVELNSNDLRLLSSEMSRLAVSMSTITDLAMDAKAPGQSYNPELTVPADVVRHVIRSRRRRSKFLPTSLFSEPAWDILLFLFHSELKQQRTFLSNIAELAQIPTTTALRWVSAMANEGLLVRRDDPLDGRRVFIELSSKGSEAMRKYFIELMDAQLIS